MKFWRELLLTGFIILLSCLDLSVLSAAEEDSEGVIRQETNHDNQAGPEESSDTRKLIEEVEQALQKVKDKPVEKDASFVPLQSSGVMSGAGDEDENSTRAIHSMRGQQASPARNRGTQSMTQQPFSQDTQDIKEAEGELMSSGESERIRTSPVLIEAFVDKSTVTIGEKIKYNIVVDAEKGVEVEFPQFGENLGGFAVKDFNISKSKKSGRNRIRQEQWYLLDSYTVGSYVIPSQSIRAKLGDGTTKTLTTPEIFVEVRSVLGNDSEKEGLRDIKAPLEIPVNLRRLGIFLWTVVFILTLLGVLAWMIYLRRLKNKQVTPPLPAHELAYRELKRIESLDLIGKGQVKEYYYLVSSCLRNYLENRFSLRAPEQTTEEFLESVAQGEGLEGRQINLLKDYLRHCDLVKYAKLEPNRTEIEELMAKTRRFIDETKIVPEETGELEEVGT
ncbi:MAG: BatD family protein [Candidatus Omnitrophica bacterium]|nr:BatD family protein [Candidatus Omnitrophota bacterium]